VASGERSVQSSIVAILGLGPDSVQRGKFVDLSVGCRLRRPGPAAHPAPAFLLAASLLFLSACGSGGPIQIGLAGSLSDPVYAGNLFAQLRFEGPADALWRLSAVELIDVTGNLRVAADVTGSLRQPLVRGSMAGDALHNVIDGMLIAAAFINDASLGVLTGAAIALHELPRELGTFAILVRSGMSVSRALAFNALTAAGALAGSLREF
jgi:hypothetical protein